MKTYAPTLKAMASNYAEGHRWDGLDKMVCERAAAEIERLREALTPSAETKAAYIGEFQFSFASMGVDENDEPYEYERTVTVPWTTIKDIMEAILERADQ